MNTTVTGVGQDPEYYGRYFDLDAKHEPINDPRDSAGEVFFSQLSRSQWRVVASCISRFMTTCSVNQLDFETLKKFLDLVDQFAFDDGTDEDE